MSRNMAHANHPVHANNDLLLWALVISLVLHSAALGLLPGFSFSHPVKIEETLTVELQQLPPPPPAKEPEKPKQPEPPKPEPKPRQEKLPPPKPLPQPVIPPPAPAVVPQHNEAPPPPAAAAEPPKVAPAQAVIALEPKPVESPQAFTAPVATANVPAPPDDEDIQGAIYSYGNKLTAELSKLNSYPPTAIKNNWTGTVKILLKFDSKSKKLSYSLSQTSGRKVLDDDALKNFQLVLDNFSLPSGTLENRDFSVNVPIKYKLKNL
jgi:protein TonB